MKEDILKYLIEDRKFIMINEGKSPYWHYSIGIKFTGEYYIELPEDEFHEIITIWFDEDNGPGNVEIYSGGGEIHFKGCVYDLGDMKTILYLLFDSIDGKTGRHSQIKNLVI